MFQGIMLDKRIQYTKKTETKNIKKNIRTKITRRMETKSEHLAK